MGAKDEDGGPKIRGKRTSYFYYEIADSFYVKIHSSRAASLLLLLEAAFLQVDF